MAGKSSFIYVLLLLGFRIRICSGQTTATCNAADGVGSWMEDGTCDPQNLISECNWDGGDCCTCTCENNTYVCGTDGYLCLDPTPVNDDVSTCEEESPPPCSVEDQLLVVENTTQAVTLAERVNCSGGVFDVKWRGDIVVNTEIVVSYGTVLNITGVGSSAIIDGGGKTRLFRVVNASLQLKDIVIRKGNATFGGAIAAANSTLTLNRTSFIGNMAAGKNGGAMFLYGSSASFSGQTEFFNNSAKYGGALYAVSNSIASWEGVSNFSGNSATHSGGALGVVVGSTVSWAAKTIFEENIAARYRGGAVFLEGGSIASWNEEANFIANSALYEGGAIFVDLGSNAYWSGSIMFSYNSVTFAGGGAMLIADSSTVELKGEATFEFNSCGLEGGAVSSRDISTSIFSGTQESFLSITGLTIFSNNKCGSNGGGVALLGGLSASFVSKNITFVGNEAGVAGGGVFISTSGGGPGFSNTAFDSNSAEVGGGVYISGSGTSLDISDDEFSAIFDTCSFIDNKAVATGGAIEIATGAVVITNTVFKGNKAETGGALRIAGATSLGNCTFKDNLVDGNGAPAILTIGSVFDIYLCSFSDNTYDCEVGTFINESGSGDRFDFVCSGCDGCETCTVENRLKVPRTCSAELEHSSSPGGHFITLETLSIDHGYWRATNESTTILKCYNEDACVGGLTGSVGFCHEGYTGPYCAVCAEKYVKGPGFTCIKCSDSVWGIVAATVIVVIAMVITLTVFTFLTSAGMVGRGRGITARLLRRVPLHSLKIIIVAWQIVTQFSSATGLTYPGLYQHFLNVVSVLNFDFSWLLSAACMIDVDFHDRLLIVTIGPAMLMLFLSGTYTYVLQRHRASEESLRNLRNKHMSVVLFVMFLVYSTSSSVVFQMFDCEVLDDKNNYLRADYTIQCDEPRHSALMVYAGFMILLYPLGIPAFFAYLLFQNRGVLMDKTNREYTLSVRPISDLWKPYKPSRFYYEVIECGRRIVLTGVILTIEYDSAAQIAVTLILAFVFTVMSEGLAPYESHWDAWVSRLAHAVVFCSVYYALLLKVDASDETNASQSKFEVVLVVTHIVMVLLVICEATVTGCLFQKDEQVEDPWPRPNRHCPERFRAASNSLCGTWLETHDSLDTDEENISDIDGGQAIIIIGSDIEIDHCNFSNSLYNCEPGTYLDESKSGDRFEAVCRDCDACETCEVESEESKPTCSTAMEHTNSSGGTNTTLQTRSIESGYWRAINDSVNILACYNEDACEGGLTGSYDYCREGYTGPYCSVCIDNYVKGTEFTCTKCSENIWGIVAAVTILVVSMVIAFAAVKYVMSVDMGYRPGIITRLLRRVPLQSVKIVIVAWQILTQFAAVADVTYTDLYQNFLNVLDIYFFNLTWMISAGCFIVINFHGQLLISIIGPMVVMLFLGGTYNYVKRKHHASEEALMIFRHKHVSVILLVMSLVYSCTNSAVFQMFDCEKLDDGNNYLRTDYTIECDSPRHRALMVYAGFMLLLYPLGIPAFFAYLLFQNRKVLTDDATREEALDVKSISDLWKPYRPSRFYYEVIECGRRTALTGVVLIGDDDSAAQIAVTLILAFVFTVVSEGLAPFESQLDAWVSRLGHAVVAATVYYALLLKVDISEETQASQSTFDVVLIVSHVTMILAVIGEALITVYSLNRGQVEDPWPRFHRYRSPRIYFTTHLTSVESPGGHESPHFKEVELGVQRPAPLHRGERLRPL